MWRPSCTAPTCCVAASSTTGTRTAGRSRTGLRAAGYPYRKVAENIAAGQRTAAEVVAGWMDSPGHRRNILDGELAQIGVGHVTGGPYGVLWTQVFGTRR